MRNSKNEKANVRKIVVGSMMRKSKYILKDLLVIILAFQGFYLIAAWHQEYLWWFSQRLRDWDKIIQVMAIWAIFIMVIFVLQKTVFARSKYTTPTMVAVVAFMAGLGIQFL